MTATAHLYSQVEDAEREMKQILGDCLALQDQIDAALEDFAMKYPNADIHGLSQDFATRLADVVDDLQGPAYRRKSRIEDEIGNIEEADLQRNSPVVL